MSTAYLHFQSFLINKFRNNDFLATHVKTIFVISNKKWVAKNIEIQWMGHTTSSYGVASQLFVWKHPVLFSSSEIYFGKLARCNPEIVSWRDGWGMPIALYGHKPQAYTGDSPQDILAECARHCGDEVEDIGITQYWRTVSELFVTTIFFLKIWPTIIISQRSQWFNC